MTSRVATQTAAIADDAAPGIAVVERVEASPVRTVPFDHVYMEGVFSPSFYRRLLDALPETRRYRELRHEHAIQPDGTSARRKFYLYPEHLWFLPARDRALWREVSRTLLARETQDAFKRKFRRELEERFGRSIDRMQFYPTPILLRDFGGYRIGVHYDSPGKAINVQFYLPRDDSQAHLGTILHESDNGAGPHPLGFRPATGYAFPIAIRHSWHSVARTSPEDGVRESLMLTFYAQDTLLRRIEHRLRRVAVFLGYFFRK